MNLSASDFQSIRRWIYRNARPLDLARWQFKFESGAPAAVLAALSAYQNEDGGFGNAIEPDFWNPNSSPYATQTAIHYLEEIVFRERQHPIIQGILRYLLNTPHFDGERWAALIDSHQDYPHAPWWTDRSYDWGFTPTALLAGFVLYYANPGEAIYHDSQQIVTRIIDTYLHGSMPGGEPYQSVRREGEIHCLTSMVDFLEDAGLAEAYDLAGLKSALNRQAQTFIEKDDAKWEQYCWKPSVFVKSPHSLFYPGNEQAIEVELDYLLSKRNPQGIWDITWSWGAYEPEFAISRNWWKTNVAIENLLLLRNFGRL